MKSKKHKQRRDIKEAESSGETRPVQSRIYQMNEKIMFFIVIYCCYVTFTTISKSKDVREEFILDFIKMCTISDIPLENTGKMLPFMRKHCKQGGALPQAQTLRTRYVPRLFELHFSALKEMVQTSALLMRPLMCVTGVFSMCWPALKALLT